MIIFDDYLLKDLNSTAEETILINFNIEYLNRVSLNLAILIAKNSAPSIRNEVGDKNIQLVIRECLKKALVAFLSFFRNLPSMAEKSLAELLERYFSNIDVGAALAVMLRGTSPDRRDLYHVWGELGGISIIGVEFDFELAFDTFESVFLKSAFREEAMESLIDEDTWQRQTLIPLETLQSIDKFLNILENLNLDSLDVFAGNIRGIVVNGNVERSLILCGNNNVVNLFIRETDEQPFSYTDLDNEKLALLKYCERLKQHFSNINLFGSTSAGSEQQQKDLQRMKDINTGFIPLHFAIWNERPKRITPLLEMDSLFFQKKSRFLMLIRGLSGSGKTTLLRYLTYQYTSQHLNSIKPWLPVYLRLKHLNLQKTRLVEFVRRQINADCWDHFQYESITKEYRFLDRDMVLLLDGLDEIENSETRNQIAGVLSDFISEYPRCNIILTSRPIGLKREEFLEFEALDLKPLSSKNITSYLKNWFAGKVKLRHQLERLLKNKTRIGQLAENPFLLSMICFTYQQDGDMALAERRGVLYEKCTKILLQRLYDVDVTQTKSTIATYEDSLELLKELSLRFFLWGEANFALQHVNTLGLNILKKRIEQNSENLLTLVEKRTGLIIRTHNGFSFIHRSLWEYFTALALLEKSPNIIVKNAANPDWEEVVRLYAGMLFSRDKVNKLLSRLWDINRPLALRATTEISWPARDLLESLIGQSNNLSRLLLIDALDQSLALIQETKHVEIIEETLRILLFDCEEKDCQVIFRAQSLLDKHAMNPLAPGGLIYELLDLQDAEARQQEFLSDSNIHFEWIEVEGGEFIMGDDHHEDDEKPSHRVVVSDFQINKYTVTNALINSSKFSFPFTSMFRNYGPKNNPAVGNTWWEVYYFALWLNARLPTEAEWEYTARGGKFGKESVYYFGDNPNKLPYNAWFGEPENKFAHEVDEINPFTRKENLNPLGVANILGNVLEWCNDWYSREYYEQCSLKQSVTNPLGPEETNDIVIRGGSWIDSAELCRSSNRDRNAPSHRSNYVGFRLVKM